MFLPYLFLTIQLHNFLTKGNIHANYKKKEMTFGFNNTESLSL